MVDEKSACVYLGIGSNLGDRVQNVFKTVKLLDSHNEIDVLRIAPLYKTAPLDYIEQGDFVNTVLEVFTSRTPFDLLYVLQGIEKKLKREKTVRFGPRTIDIDILLYDELVINTQDLVIPHPKMRKRAFVCCPLADLIPNRVLVGGKTVKQLAKELVLSQRVEEIRDYT